MSGDDMDLLRKRLHDMRQVLADYLHAILCPCFDQWDDEPCERVESMVHTDG